eukprot:355977-Chlamydomonas_euryale.AAC.1
MQVAGGHDLITQKIHVHSSVIIARDLERQDKTYPSCITTDFMTLESEMVFRWQDASAHDLTTQNIYSSTCT